MILTVVIVCQELQIFYPRTDSEKRRPGKSCLGCRGQPQLLDRQRIRRRAYSDGYVEWRRGSGKNRSARQQRIFYQPRTPHLTYRHHEEREHMEVQKLQLVAQSPGRCFERRPIRCDRRQVIVPQPSWLKPQLVAQIEICGVERSQQSAAIEVHALRDKKMQPT